MKSILKSLIKNMIKYFYNIKVYGTENLIKDGKRIYICNHQSMLDAVIISLFIDEEFYFVMNKTVGSKIDFKIKDIFIPKKVKSIIKNRIILFFAGLVNVIKVDSNSPYSVKEMINVVNAGKVLLIFPEGKITTTGKLEEIQDGVGFVALKTGATIIPLKLTGLLETHFSYLDNDKKIFNDVVLSINESFKIINDKQLSSSDNRKNRIDYIKNILDY